ARPNGTASTAKRTSTPHAKAGRSMRIEAATRTVAIANRMRKIGVTRTNRRSISRRRVDFVSSPADWSSAVSRLSRSTAAAITLLPWGFASDAVALARFGRHADAFLAAFRIGLPGDEAPALLLGDPSLIEAMLRRQIRE